MYTEPFFRQERKRKENTKRRRASQGGLFLDCFWIVWADPPIGSYPFGASFLEFFDAYGCHLAAALACYS
jgi:hypothetical protein